MKSFKSTLIHLIAQKYHFMRQFPLRGSSNSQLDESIINDLKVECFDKVIASLSCLYNILAAVLRVRRYGNRKETLASDGEVSKTNVHLQQTPGSVVPVAEDWPASSGME